MNRLVFICTLTFSLLATIPAQAKNIYLEQLSDDTDITQVSESLISKGIAAYKMGNYRRAAWMFETFLSPRKVVLTPTEKEGLKCLALAYQKLGKGDLVDRTIKRLKFSLELSTVKTTVAKKYNGYRCS